MTLVSLPDLAPTTLLIEPHYFPSVAYVALLSQHERILLEVHEHYPKQTYRNRCYVQGANRVQLLSVPVQKPARGTITKDIQVDGGTTWRHHHWRTLRSAYGKAPFFDFFAQTFHDILYQKSQFLLDFSIPILTECLKILQLEKLHLTESKEYQKEPSGGQNDLRNTLRAQLPPDCPAFFRPVPYHQVFGKDFVPNLSVIDLLFCEGSRANSIIRRSIVDTE